MRYFFVLVCVLFFFCCTPEKKSAPRGKLRVLATTGMIYDSVREIAHDSVEATALMGPGIDPHVYKASEGDIRKLQSADLILYNGLFLEGKMGEILQRLSKSKHVIAVAESIPKSLLRAHPTYVNAYDPHVWFDVQKWRSVVKTVSAALSRLDPRNARLYKRNAQRYDEELVSLDGWIRKSLDTLPSDTRILITAHDAFGYFGEAYAMEVRGLQGISTQAEFGLRDITEVVDFIVEKKIKAVFVESSVSDKALKAVVAGCQSKGHSVRIGGKLYSDAMGAFGTEEGTYIGMVKANVRTIVQGLMGDDDTYASGR